MFNQKKVSQERVIGISFVDILIQAVFVLLLALMVGYMDPIQKLNLEKLSEYGQVGKDLCHKLNKDSVAACREIIGSVVQVDPNDVGKKDFGEDICKRLKAKDLDDCKVKAKKILSNQSLFPCLESESRNAIPFSTKWELVSLEEITFKGFTQDYKNYIIKNNDVKKIATVSEFEKIGDRKYKLENIESSFGFIREAGCFHSYQLTWVGINVNSTQVLSPAYTALNRLKNFTENN